MANNNI